MIKPNELQKGNLVTYGSEYFIIESLDSMNGRTDITLSNISNNAFYQEVFTTIEKLAFVPLERKIFELLRFEVFMDNKGTTYYNPKDFNYFFLVGAKGNFEFRVISSRKVCFVHELQNMFLFLIKKELDIKNLANYICLS